ncbi:hypothetical protein KIN20_000138 [Parelaphostrongylus tenuis]|uniref:Uncharacterized protein n=1 Tax=Parelaphostrongylus tenuis TaxID=148309 RepID=A0AAD5LVP1_PARTN|nr:hypothetical protein KIN20_000138 [Parelaphostrongylus tenuis]
MHRKWKLLAIPVDLRSFLEVKFAVVGYSSSYLVTMPSTVFEGDMLMNIYELSPQYAIRRNVIHLRDCDCFDEFRVYFHPCNRFLSVLVYNPEDFCLSNHNGCSQSSVLRVCTVFPDLSLCLSMTSSVTIVSRAESRDSDPMKKEHLRIHNNGFILNTGVTLVVIVFSHSPPTKIPQQKIWRVVKHNDPSFDAKPSSIVVGSGEVLAVESSLIYTTRERISYSLEDCDEQSLCDPKWACGLHKPLFVSRQEICVETLIHDIMTQFFLLFRGTHYRGIRDYETDVHRIDNQRVCAITIVCICEVQVLMDDGESTQNFFYLCLLETNWSVFSGWSRSGTCQIIKKLTKKVVRSVFTVKTFALVSGMLSIKCKEVFPSLCRV